MENPPRSPRTLTLTEALAPESAPTELSGDTAAAGSYPGSDPRDIADPDEEIAIVPNELRYELRATLGEGGMGEVRLCRDRVIGREVALKAVLPAHAKHTGIRARFVREARVQGQLEHPAIVPVYDFGVDGSGQPFFTMKRVRGVTLERVLDALRRGDEATARLYTSHRLLAAFVQVCLAIDFAHERGVLHRDLKPANVMLGGYGEVYVLDWGLAKVRSSSVPFESSSMRVAEAVDPSEARKDVVTDVTSSAAPTAAGAVLGTPGYMAPEQLRADPLDARTDIYLLGGVLFEILTLEPLHGEGSLAGVMSRALQGVDARASARAPGREVAPELEAVCVRACARDAKDRPASARELANAVEAYLSGDRDVELRRTLAKVHLDRARDAVAEARVPGAPSAMRTEALREVGRAVALDPTDPVALALLVGLLTEPPAEPPAEVIEAVETARQDSQRRMLPRVAFFYAVSFVVFLPVQAYLGVLSWKLLVMPIAAWSVSAVAVGVVHRYFARLHPYIAWLMLLAAIALGTSSVVFGPLLLLPTMVVMSTMGTILVTRKDRRTALLVCNVLAMMVPTALAWLGSHPVSHVVDGDRTLRISVAAFAITRDGAFAILAASHLFLLAVGTVFASRYRDALTAAETKNYLQAWQLRQLVPAEATRALAPTPPVRAPRSRPAARP